MPYCVNLLSSFVTLLDLSAWQQVLFRFMLSLSTVTFRETSSVIVIDYKKGKPYFELYQ